MSFANGRWVKDWIAPKPRTVAVAIVVVFALSLAAFLWDVDTPNVMMFDETWYVPTAQKWLAAGEMMHEEHPPLGKLMIALGMWLFGDNPFGWRVMSAGFGALAVSGTFLWAFALLRSVPQALWAAAVVFCSHVVFVQARIAMLDIFLMAFCTLALAFFTFSIKEPDRRRSLGYALAMGVCLGLASACKWSGFFLLFGLAGAYLLIALLRTWRVRFEDPRTTDFYAPGGWPAMTPLAPSSRSSSPRFSLISPLFFRRSSRRGRRSSSSTRMRVCLTSGEACRRPTPTLAFGRPGCG